MSFSSDNYWQEFERLFQITPMSKGQGDTCICMSPNQTIFVIPDPETLLSDAQRRAVFNFVVADLAQYVMPS